MDFFFLIVFVFFAVAAFMPTSEQEPNSMGYFGIWVLRAIMLMLCVFSGIFFFTLTQL